MCTLTSVVGALSSILGTDLLLRRSNFFNKEPGGVEVPWHQDRNFWPLASEDVLTAWIAIDPVDRENSCVRVVPGTHRRIFDHVDAGPGCISIGPTLGD
ncbi:MAG: hypothetical protein GKR86_12875, partial [Ilumatobacter sp.]|nr:hypothetical protein [Ilumatobacter sp.]